MTGYNDGGRSNLPPAEFGPTSYDAAGRTVLAADADVVAGLDELVTTQWEGK